MAIYAIMMVFAAIVGFVASIIDYYLGIGAAAAFVGIWSAIGIIVAAPTIVERGRPKKVDDLFRYLVAAVVVGPFMLMDMMKFYGEE